MTDAAAAVGAGSDAGDAGGALGAARTALARPTLFWALAIVLGVTGAAAQFVSYLTPDAAWYLYASRRMLDGARLYVDVVEINPPLIILLSAPAAAVARWVGASEIQTFRVLVLLLVSGSLLAATTFFRRLLGARDRTTANVLLLFWLFALLPLTRADFGQREHLLMALVLPYLAAASARAAGVRPPTPLALLAGVLAGVGMSLKPHFGLLWLGVESYLWLSARRGPPWRRVEGAAAAVMPVVYGVVVLLVTPAYLDLVRLLGGSYAAYLTNSPLAILMNEPWAGFTIVALLAALALRPADANVARVTDVLAVAAGTLLLAALSQQKGWRYHLYPAFATATVLLGVLAITPLRDARSRGARVYALLARLLAVAVVITVCVDAARQAVSPNDPRYQPYPEFRELLGIVERHRARDDGALLVLSNNLRSAFPLVNYGEIPWAARANAVWLLPAIYARDLVAGRPPAVRDRPAMSPAERFLNDALVEDMARYRPTLLIVERPLTGRGINPVRRLDYLAYFGRDERFAKELAQFTRTRDVGDYEVYERVAERRGK